MQNIKEKIQQNINLKKYKDLINKIAKVEYKSIGTQHLIEFDELVNIGLQTINTMCSQKNFDSFNESYLSTAIKWAIRNELRNRYRWYGVRQSRQLTETEQAELKDAIYSTMMTLPKREKELIESKFFKEKKLHELSDEFSISPSRISRIIKGGLDKIKDELIKSEVV